MSITQIFPENYTTQLQEKQSRLRDIFLPFYQQDIAVFSSPASHYRMRAEFRLWHEKDDVFYAMQDPRTPEKPVFLDQFPVANLRINALMELLLIELRQEPLLKKRLFQVEFLTSTLDEAVITLVYHRKLDAIWQTKSQ